MFNFIFWKAMPVALRCGSVPLFLLPIVIYKNNDMLSASVPSGLGGQGNCTDLSFSTAMVRVLTNHFYFYQLSMARVPTDHFIFSPPRNKAQCFFFA
jgi:hypothetical protein